MFHLLLLWTYLSTTTALFTPNNLIWTTTSHEPTQNRLNQPIIGNGMPIGNGQTTGYIFSIDPEDGPFVTPGTDGFVVPVGIGIMVDMPEAMASDGSLFGLGMVSIDTIPSIFSENDWRLFYKQTLNVSEASVTIATNVATIKVWIDAGTNAITTCVQSKQPVDLQVQLQSFRPTHGRFEYMGEDISKLKINATTPTSNPDSFTTKDNVLTISHRNVQDDKPAYFNDTLRQQGMGDYVDALYTQGSDRWSNRQFGMSISGKNLKNLNVINTPDANNTAIVRHHLMSSSKATTFQLLISTHANQTDSNAMFQHQLNLVHQHNQQAQAAAAKTATSIFSPPTSHVTWWSNFWSRSHVVISGGAKSDNTLQISNKYTWTRYLQTIQIQGGIDHWVPIKFNGLCFTTQLPPDTNTSGPAARGWGPNSWWQNTRLPYGPMLGSGDFDDYTNVLEFILQMVPFARQRTEKYFNHSGIFFVETKTLFGSYRPADYGDYYDDRNLNNVTTVPYQYMLNSYIRYDFGGDGGTTEISNMVLDYYEHTQNEPDLQRYSIILLETITFYLAHYKETRVDPSTGRMVMRIFPTQSLETYWCAWVNSQDMVNNTWVPPNDQNCMSNDHPTVVSLHVLVERSFKLLPSSSIWTKELNDNLTTLKNILPPIPLIVDDDGIERTSPYAEYPINDELHNGETPELYGVHPFRHYSIGRSLLSNINIQPALQCFTNSSRATCINGQANDGWTQGIMIAALLGQTKQAKTMVVQRGHTTPAVGYRFPAFAPANQDYEPSADHYANQNMAIQWMLLQPADDVNSSMILFGAWPCDWDVDFKLHGPLNTVVMGTLTNGTLVHLEVEPKERRKDVINMLQC